ncbi:MAG: hypothetical protein ACX930_06090 [Erythrobacter sp.]
MTKQERSKHSKTYWTIALVLMGAVGGYVGADLATGGANGEPLIDLSLSSLAALTLGVILIFAAILVGVGAASPRLGISMIMFEDREQWEDEKLLMWLSAIGSGAYGLIVAILALVEPLDLAVGVPLLAGLSILLGALFYTCWRILREYDELWHEINAEMCVVGFYLTFLVGGIWSIGAHLGFIPALAPLDWITLLTAASLTGAIVATKRRGMLEE